jgi:hypothetical protein
VIALARALKLPAGMCRRHALVLAFAALAAATAVTSGCAPVSYRVPGIEVQRLAQIDPAFRGSEIRVVPRTAPLAPATRYLAPSAPAASPDPEPPPPPDAVSSATRYLAPPQGGEPPPGAGPPRGSEPSVSEVGEGGVGVDVVVDRPVVVVESRVGDGRRGYSGRTPAGVAGAAGGGWRGAPAVAVSRAAPPAGAGGAWRGAPAGAGGAWRGAPVAAASRPAPAPASFGRHVGAAPRLGGRSAGHRGGGGGAVAAAAIGVVAIVGIVAAASIAEDHARRAEAARNYDGWVSVAANHPLHLHYGRDRVRVVPLCNLRLEDTVGLQYAVLRASEGEVEHGRPLPPASAPPPPPYGTSPP